MPKPRRTPSHLADVPGYVRLPGPQRRYENTLTGETISRRQYDNLRIQASASPYQNRAQIERYRSGRNLEAQRHARILKARQRMAPPSKTSGPNLDPDDLTSDYHRLYLAAQKDRKNRSPDGPMANYLTAIGLREPDDTWDVGETQIS